MDAEEDLAGPSAEPWDARVVGAARAFSRMGLVFETAPMQVVDRAQEVGLVDGWSPRALRLPDGGRALCLRRRRGDGFGSAAP